MRWLALVAFLVVLGCAPRLPDRWLEVPPADQLLARLGDQAGKFTSLDAAAAVKLTTGSKFFSSQQFLLLERPNRVRADVLTGFGQLALQLASDGERLAVFLNNTVPGRFLYGPASDANLMRFIRIPLAAEDLLAILLYDPPLIDYNTSRTLVTDNRLELILEHPGSQQLVVFDENLRVVGCRYWIQKKLVLEVEYEKFKNEADFPARVSIGIPVEDTRVVLNFTELQLNTLIDSARFSLEQPKNSLLEALP